MISASSVKTLHCASLLANRLTLQDCPSPHPGHMAGRHEPTSQSPMPQILFSLEITVSFLPSNSNRVRKSGLLETWVVVSGAKAVEVSLHLGASGAVDSAMQTRDTCFSVRAQGV